MNPILVASLTTLLVTVATLPARAAEPVAGSWDAQVGPARVDLREEIILSRSGAPFPGGRADAQDNTILAAELTYHITPSWSAAVTVGFPPRSAVTGRGEAARFGVLGSMRYLPIALMGKYQFDTGSALHPYVGVGGVYAVVQASDGYVRDLKVDNTFGAGFQAGVQYDLTPGLGLFLDFKKFLLKTNARGTAPGLGGAGGVPVSADVTLDPLVFQVGVVVRF